MFDRNVAVVAPRTTEVREVTKHVHEHRAPTDESIRLLGEMEVAARSKIIQAMQVGNTAFECVVHFMRVFEDDSIVLRAVFSLNGAKMTAEYIEPAHVFNRQKAIVGLRDAMAKEIATTALRPALEQMLSTTAFASIKDRA